MMELVESKPNAPVIVLAASTLRAAPLDRLADELRQRGAAVEVVAGVDHRRVELLKLSFRYRAEAAYLLFGGPELPEEALRSIATELEANGVPKGRVSGAMMRWDDAREFGRNAIDRLASMGVDVDDGVPELPMPALSPPSPPPPPLESSPNRPPSSGRVPRRTAWAVGGVAAIAAVAVISLTISSGDASADEPEVRTASALVGGSTETPEQPAAAPSQAIEVAPQEPGPKPQPEEPVELEIIEPMPDALPDPGAEPPLPTGDDAALVYAALRSQSIRALDILLVSPPASRKRGRRTVAAKMNFESAREHCENLGVEGVEGWRLPEIGEVQWLSKSNLIRTGIFWTATKADAFGSERVIWNPRSKRMRSSTQRWRGGRVVCVRYQNGDDPGPR